MSTKARNPFGSLLNGLQSIVSDIEAHQNEVFNEKKSIPQTEIIKKLQFLQDSVNWFCAFNEDFMKTLGITRKDIAHGMNKRQKGSDADNILTQAEKLKTNLLLSYAEFLKKSTEKTKGGALSKEALLVTKEAAKKEKKKLAKPKGGFKKMTQGQKWKKM